MPNITALGFDFGLRRIGVAVGENITNTARPLVVLPANNGQTDLPTLEKLIKSWRPQVLVVGIPYTEDGGEQETSKLARNFAQFLTTQFATQYYLQVVTTDERYSSIEAKRIFAEMRKNKQIKQGESLDHIAACVILERWLNNQTSAY